jgi:uncharacterized protein (TIGR03435 family)
LCRPKIGEKAMMRGGSHAMSSNRKLAILAAVSFCLVFFVLHAQNRELAVKPGASVPTSLEVASIRPSKSPGPPIIRPTHDGLIAKNVTVNDLVRDAFWQVAFQEGRIFGLPEWTRVDRYDVAAKMSGDDYGDLRQLTEDAQNQLRQQLLIDRFGLKFHYESRAMPAFHLVVAKGGAKLKPGPPPADFPTGILHEKPGKLTASGVRVERLASYLMRLQNRPVIDKTGLTGSYDFSLEWQPDEPSAVSPAEAASGQDATAIGAGSTLPVALREQLGLQLVGARETVEILVVDHIERASDN